MKEKINLQNNYYCINQNVLSNESLLKLILKQPNLIGINVVDKNLQAKCSSLFNTFQYEDSVSALQLIENLLEIFSKKSLTFNIIFEVNFEITIILCAAIEQNAVTKQRDSKSLHRLLELVTYFNTKKLWGIQNNQSTKDTEIIEDLLRNENIDVNDKILIIVEYLNSGILPPKIIKRFELKREKIINLLNSKKIVLENTFIPTICYELNEEYNDYKLGESLAPLVLRELKTKYFNSENNLISNFIISGNLKLIKNTEELGEDLHKYFSSKNQIIDMKMGNNEILLKDVDSSKINKDHLIIIIGKYLK